MSLDITKAAAAHFKTRRDIMGGFAVKEWGGVKVYYRAPTVAERSAIQAAWRDGAHIDGVVATVVQIACDEKGVKLFNPLETSEIASQYDPDVLEWVANQIKINRYDPSDANTSPE